jgi:hypothetical protein
MARSHPPSAEGEGVDQRETTREWVQGLTNHVPEACRRHAAGNADFDGV